MKKTTLRQAALKLALVAVALLAPLGLRAQETLTVYDQNTTTNSYIPFNSLYADYGTRSQFIIPADQLVDLDGANITKLAFYAASASTTYDQEFTVYMKEVDYSVFGSATLEDWSSMTPVYVGTIAIDANNVMEIDFSSPYTYEGGNLMIGFQVTNWGTTCPSKSWYGVNQTSGTYTAAYNNANSSHTWSTTITRAAFLPKTTFTYEPAATGGCEKPETFEYSNLSSNGATLTWTGGSGTYNVDIKGGSYADWAPYLTNTTLTTTTPNTLESNTAYQFRVQSVCSEEVSTYKTLNFTTLCGVISSFPWSTNFDSYSGTTSGSANNLPTCWSYNNGTTYSSYSGYPVVYNGSSYSHSGNNYLRFYSYYSSYGSYTYTDQYAILPQMADVNTLRIKMYARLYNTSYNSSLTIGVMTDPNDISTFTPLGTVAPTSTTYSEFTTNLDGYTGTNGYIAIKMEPASSSSTYQGVYVDDITVEEIPSCLEPSDLQFVSSTTTTAILSWTAGGSETAWDIYYSTDNLAPTTQTGTNTSDKPATISGLTAATPYYVWVRAHCSDADQSPWIGGINFTTACPDYPLDYTCGFEGPNTTGSYQLPLCWTRMGSSTSYPYISTSNPHGGTHSLYFYNYSGTSYRNEIAVLPAIDAYLNTVRISFYGKVSSITSDNDIRIGYVTDLNDTTTFNLVETVTLTTSYEKYTVSFGNVGNATGYIALRSFYTGPTKYIYIDDILVEEIPSCLEPTAASVVENSETVNSVQLTWTSGNETPETNWKLQYKKATDENYTTVNVTSAELNDGKYTLTGLTASTNYNWQVAAWCNTSDENGISLYTAGPDFQTECVALTITPSEYLQEGFEGYEGTAYNANGVIPVCWIPYSTATYAPHVIGSGSYYYVHEGTKALTFYGNGTNYAALPEISNDLNTLQVKFWMRVENTSCGTLTLGYITDEDNGTFNTFTAIPGITIANSSTMVERGPYYLSGIPDNATRLVFRWYYSSQYSCCIDDVEVSLAPSCRPVTNLTSTVQTAHDATLSWTNGAASQNAWQIAYSTTADFDPDTVTPVDVTTNPATIEGLAQSTTYYAYVRANCGNEDGLSDWCINKVTFNTLAGNVTPTGLAVAPATITSSQATASWNAVAGNTLHQSYDIYWAEATVNEVPVEPTAPNLIAGITATSQILSGLTPETNYKVWVRDNCGTDGLSNWSSPVTFTTAASCQIPDGLVASNVTNNSATISWNTYGQSGFNLRYSTDGENWTTEPDINTPYTLDGVLTGNTAYQVQVQATCNTEAWSATLNFTTKCDAITAFPVSYGFETTEGFTAGVSYSSSAPTSNNLGNCWRNQATSNDGSNTTRLWCTATTPHDGTQSLMLPDKGSSGSYNTTLLAFPAMNFTSVNGYKVSFWIKREATNSNPEGFKVYASHTDTIDGSAVLLGHYSRNYNIAYPQIEDASGWYQYDIYVPQATMTGTVYLIFEGQSYYGNATYVDDITIDEAPSCYPLGTLTYANVGTHSVELSWPLVDNGQTAWVVEYADNSEFNNFQTASANTHTDFELAVLTPETHYWVRVKANCGNDDYSEVSNVVDFTTGIACPAPTALAYDNASLTETSVDLSWTENGGATEWIVAYKAEGDADSTEVTATNTNYTLTGTLQHPLTQGTNYTVKVRANCGNVNGLSQWSNVVNFQTVAACPAPTNLAVTDASETAHGATITWNGNVDNDSYTVEYAEGPMAGLATLLDEDFEGGSMPTGWTTDGPGTWSIGTGDYSNGTGAGHGTYNAKITHNTNNYATKLITPEIDLSGVTSPTLSYMHIQRSWSGDQDKLRVYYRISSSDPWTLLAGQEYTAAVATWTSENNIALPNPSSTYQIAFEMTDGYGYGVGVDNVVVTGEYTPSYSWNTLANDATSPYEITTLDPETQYVVRVKGVCGSTPSPASNIAGFTTLEACGAPTAFVLGDVEAHQATFSWTGGVDNEAWKVYVKEHGAAEYPDSFTNVNTASVTIDELDAATAYDVKIVPTCNESKILEVENAFTTPCEDINIIASWTEDFNSLSENGEIPNCWNNGDGTTVNVNYKWCYYDGGYSNGNTNGTSHDGSNCIRFNSFNNSEGYTNFLKTPVLNFPDGIPMSLYFWYKKPVAGAGFSVYISTDGGATYTTPLAENLAQKTSWYEQTIPLTNYVGDDNIVIVFKGTSDYGNGDDYIYLDDVTIKPYSIEKAILANKWYAISSPVHNSDNDETVAGVTNLTSGTYDLYGYTESAGTWNKPTAVLEQGRGYIYRRAAAATLSFVGTPNSDGIRYNLSYACSDNDLKGFNLVGNPYPQAATPGMACYSLTPAGLWYAQLATYNAAVCEAVLVKTGSPDNEVNFSTGAKGYNDTPALAFTVSNEEFEDVTYAMLDNGDGLPKIGHIATNAPELSIPVAGRRYAIATLGAEAESFELNFRGIGGEYTLTLNAQRSTLNYCHLIDRATNKEIDLLGQPTYTFNATGSDGSRFLVKLKPDAETVNTTFAIWNGEAWVVNGNGTLQVFDVLGRQLLRQDIQGSEYRIQNTQFPGSGVYILRLGDKSQKIVVK